MNLNQCTGMPAINLHAGLFFDVRAAKLLLIETELALGTVLGP
jgi:hypothetical protein